MDSRRVNALLRRVRVLVVSAACWMGASTAFAQGVTGTVRDQTGGVLPGVTVEAHTARAATKTTVTNTAGTYTLDLPAGQYQVTFSLVNFAVVKRQIEVAGGTPTTVDVTLRF